MRKLLALLCAASLLCPGPQPTAWAGQVDGDAPDPTRNALPALGDSDSEQLSIAAERRLGDQIMREIRRDPDYIDDPQLLEYLQSLWQPLVAAARARGDIGDPSDERYAWEPFLVRARSVNAFALPGGFIGVHLGLIALTTSRDELASVLAHEMSHVTQRHIARNIANSKRASLLNIAALILGALVASRGASSDSTGAIVTGGQAAALQNQLNFSRDMEREADRIGFGLMTQAGFAPNGMAAMFEKLAQSGRLNDRGAFPYLRTHPLTTERIGEARSRIGVEQGATQSIGDFEHAIAQARARVLMDPHTDALQRLKEELDAHADTPAAGTAEKLGAAYTSALASTLLGDWERADIALDQAYSVARNSPHEKASALRALSLLQAQSQLNRGSARVAQSTLAALADENASENTRPSLLLRFEVALASTSSAPNSTSSELLRVVEDLQTWVAIHPLDALAWSAISQAWKRLKQPLRALRASAESQLALGDLRGAVERLRAGQRLALVATSPADFFEASVIDARLRAIEAQHRALEAEQRE